MKKSFNSPGGKVKLQFGKALDIPQLLDLVPKRQLLFQIPTGMFDPYCHTLEELRSSKNPASFEIGGTTDFSEIDDPALYRYCQEHVSQWVRPNLTHASFLNPWQSPYPNDKPDPTEEELLAMCEKLSKYLGISTDDYDGNLLLRVLARLVIDLNDQVPGEIEALIYDSQMSLMFRGSASWEGNRFTIKVPDFYQESKPPLNYGIIDMHTRDMNISIGFRYSASDFIDPSAPQINDPVTWNERYHSQYVVKAYYDSLEDLYANVQDPAEGDTYGVGPAPRKIYRWSQPGIWLQIGSETKSFMYWETIPITPHNTWKNPDTMYFIDERTVDANGVCTAHNPRIVTDNINQLCMHVPNICLNRDRDTPLKYQVTFIDNGGEPYIGVTGEMGWQKISEYEDLYGYVANLEEDLDSDEELGVYVVSPDNWPVNYDYYDVTKRWRVDFYWRLKTYYSLDADTLLPHYWNSSDTNTVVLSNDNGRYIHWAWFRSWQVYKARGNRTGTPILEPSNVAFDFHISEDPYFFPTLTVERTTGTLRLSRSNSSNIPYYAQIEASLTLKTDVRDEDGAEFLDRFGNPISAHSKAFIWQSSRSADSYWKNVPDVKYKNVSTVWGFWQVVPQYHDFEDPFTFETQSPAYKVACCIYASDLSYYTIDDASEPYSSGCSTNLSYEVNLGGLSTPFDELVTNNNFSVTVTPGTIDVINGYSFTVHAKVMYKGANIMFPVWEVNVARCTLSLTGYYTGYAGMPQSFEIPTAPLYRTQDEYGNVLLCIALPNEDAVVDPRVSYGFNVASVAAIVHAPYSSWVLPVDRPYNGALTQAICTVDYCQSSSDKSTYLSACTNTAASVQFLRIRYLPIPCTFNVTSVYNLTNAEADSISYSTSQAYPDIEHGGLRLDQYGKGTPDFGIELCNGHLVPLTYDQLLHEIVVTMAVVVADETLSEYSPITTNVAVHIGYGTEGDVVYRQSITCFKGSVITLVLPAGIGLIGYKPNVIYIQASLQQDDVDTVYWFNGAEGYYSNKFDYNTVPFDYSEFACFALGAAESKALVQWNSNTNAFVRRGTVHSGTSITLDSSETAVLLQYLQEAHLNATLKKTNQVFGVVANVRYGYGFVSTVHDYRRPSTNGPYTDSIAVNPSYDWSSNTDYLGANIEHHIGGKTFIYSVPTDSTSVTPTPVPGSTPKLKLHGDNCDFKVDSMAYAGEDAYGRGNHIIECVPDAGYAFTGWSDGSSENPYNYNLTSDTELTASVVEASKVYIKVLRGDDGLENGGGYLIYGETDRATFDTEFWVSQGVHTIEIDQTVVTGQAMYIFDHWSDGTTDNPKIVEVHENLTLTAFTTGPHPFHTILLSGDHCKFTIDGVEYKGSSSNPTKKIVGTYTIECIPDSGYGFVSWSDGNTSSTRNVVLTSDIVLSATTRLVAQHDVTYVCDYTSVLSADDDITVNSGSSVKVLEGSHRFSVTDKFKSGNNYLIIDTLNVNGNYFYEPSFTYNVVSATTVTAAYTKAGALVLNNTECSFTVDGVSVDPGAETILTAGDHQVVATALSGVEFTGWSDGVSDSSRTVIIVAGVCTTLRAGTRRTVEEFKVVFTLDPDNKLPDPDTIVDLSWHTDENVENLYLTAPTTIEGSDGTYTFNRWRIGLFNVTDTVRVTSIPIPSKYKTSTISVTAYYDAPPSADPFTINSRYFYTPYQGGPEVEVDPADYGMTSSYVFSTDKTTIDLQASSPVATAAYAYISWLPDNGRPGQSTEKLRTRSFFMGENVNIGTTLSVTRGTTQGVDYHFYGNEAPAPEEQYSVQVTCKDQFGRTFGTASGQVGASTPVGPNAYITCYVLKGDTLRLYGTLPDHCAGINFNSLTTIVPTIIPENPGDPWEAIMTPSANTTASVIFERTFPPEATLTLSVEATGTDYIIAQLSVPHYDEDWAKAVGTDIMSAVYPAAPSSTMRVLADHFVSGIEVQKASVTYPLTDKVQYEISLGGSLYRGPYSGVPGFFSTHTVTGAGNYIKVIVP